LFFVCQCMGPHPHDFICSLSFFVCRCLRPHPPPI
jgi:hypothetical protein